MKTTVIHHSADYDGIFCREIARKFLPPDTEFIGWDFSDPTLYFPQEGAVYVMDLPVDRPFNWTVDDMHQDWFGAVVERLIWIDHHKSSIESHPKHIPGYRIDGVAACRLAWQWFRIKTDPRMLDYTKGFEWPIKQYFINRSIVEPLAVRLAGEYDVWDHRGDGDLEFQFGLDSYEHLRWDWLLSVRPNDPDPDGYAARIVEAGKISMRCYAKRDADILRSRSFLVDFEGLRFLALNTARCNSNTFAARDNPETGHDALMGFFTNGDGWSISLYHANHRKDIDLSKIAVAYGGGGHAGACGFRTRTLPFTV